VRPAVVRSLVASALVSLVAAALATAPTATATVPDAAVGEPPVRIGTYNIRTGVGLADFKAAVAALKPAVDVAGLQEIGANDRNKYLVADHGWGYFRPPKLQQNPVIWRRDLFDFVAASGHLIAKARDLHGEHSGDEAKGDSWATVVRLVQRASGEQVSFINVHLVRSAVKGGRPAPGKPHLFELLTDQVAGTVAAIKAERAAPGVDRVYVLGDFNVGYEADAKWKHRKLPFKRFGAIGLISMWKGSPLLKESYGTHNDALIDQVWSTAGANTEAILRSIKQSDHSPAVATYSLPLPDPNYVPAMGTVGIKGVTGDNVENNGPSKVPTLFVELEGDLAHGYVDVQLEVGSAMQGYDHDFVIDTSSLYDNDLSHNVIAVDIVGDQALEGDETFTLRLVNPVNTVVLPGQDEVVVTIVDNDD
jgi:hypothetical protein